MWESVKEKARLAYGILFEAGRSYGEDRVGRMAAAVTYRTIFALAPLTLIALWVFGLVIGDSATARDSIIKAVEDFGGSSLASAVDNLIASASTGANTAAVVGFALLVWTASSLFLELQNDLNDIFGTPQQSLVGPLVYMFKRGVGFVWTLGLGLLLILFWALNFLWGLFGSWFGDIGLVAVHDAIDRLSPVLSLLVMPVLFALVFQSLSRVKLRKRALYLGSIFTTVGFLVSSLGLRLYFSWDSDTSASRVAGTLFIVLLAANILSSVFFYGAEVIKVYQRYLETGEAGRQTSGETPPVVSSPEPAIPVAAVLGFLGGMLFGWRRRR